MLSWIRCFLPLIVLAIPLSTAQAAPIEVVAFNGQNPEFRFVTFGRPGRPTVDEAGRVYFRATISNPDGPRSQDSFVWEDGVVSRSPRTFPRPASLPVAGDPVPDVPGATWSRNPSGELNRNGVALVHGGSPPVPAGIMIYDAAGTGSYLVRHRDTAPGAGVRVFSGFSSEVGLLARKALGADLNDRGDVVFEASLGRVRDDDEIEHAGSGIWTRSAATGSIVPLVLSGSGVPGLPDWTFLRFTRTEIDAAGRVAFVSDIGDPTERTERALFFAGPDGDITLAARPGDVVSGGPDGLRVSGSLDDLFLNDAGLAVLKVNTRDGSGNDETSVVSVTSDGKIELLLRTGQEILIGDRMRTVNRFGFGSEFHPDFAPLVGDWLSIGVAFGTEDEEEIDGRRIVPDGLAILRIRVPEPGLAALMILAAVAIRRVARG